MLSLMTGIIMISLAVAGIVIREARRKHVGIWLPAYVTQRWSRQRALAQSAQEKSVHILFCMVDHFEPISAGSTLEQERRRMKNWSRDYPVLALRHKDSYGRPPQHTWFYPGEDYNREYLEGLVHLSQQGLGEIELHFHHGYDTGESLRFKLTECISKFAAHGALLTNEVKPRTAYGFIHGNMALDNSRGDPAFCGVNEELIILRDTGCYADFSFPTAPCISQPRKVNAIYYATDDPHRPKSYDVGLDVQVGRPASGDLMIISGPLGLDWHHRKWGIIPRIENAEIQGHNPATPDRIRNWVRQRIHVDGRPEWIIVKVSCHGAEDRNKEVLLGQSADEMYSTIESKYRDRPGYRLHYVSARELYNIIKAAEAGEEGDPDSFRDYLLPPYQYQIK
jgi:hypothetical protein